MVWHCRAVATAAGGFANTEMIIAGESEICQPNCLILVWLIRQGDLGATMLADKWQAISVIVHSDYCRTLFFFHSRVIMARRMRDISKMQLAIPDGASFRIYISLINSGNSIRSHDLWLSSSNPTVCTVWWEIMEDHSSTVVLRRQTYSNRTSPDMTKSNKFQLNLVYWSNSNLTSNPKAAIRPSKFSDTKPS